MIFISGAGSFSGVNLIKFFLKQGESIVSNYRSDNCNIESLINLKSSRLTLIKCDLKELSLYDHCLSNVNTIIHLAGASSPPSDNVQRFFSDNILGTAELLKVSKSLDCQHFVFASWNGFANHCKLCSCCIINGNRIG